MKQKTLIPLIVFLLGICLVGIILYKVDSHETAQNHTTALLNATTYGERIKNEIRQIFKSLPSDQAKNCSKRGL